MFFNGLKISWQDQFDLQGDPVDVERVVSKQFGRRLSDYTNRLYKDYQKLVNSKGKEYAREHPPKRIDEDKWIALIDKKWTNDNFLVTSLLSSKLFYTFLFFALLFVIGYHRGPTWFIVA